MDAYIPNKNEVKNHRNVNDGQNPLPGSRTPVLEVIHALSMGKSEAPHRVDHEQKDVERQSQLVNSPS